MLNVVHICYIFIPLQNLHLKYYNSLYFRGLFLSPHALFSPQSLATANIFMYFVYCL